MIWGDIKEIKKLLEVMACRVASLEGNVTELSLKLSSEERRREEVEICAKTIDKFSDYMKNVDKLNAMVNEFKGAVSLARSAVSERKQKDYVV